MTRDPSDISLENAEKRLKRTVLTREEKREKSREVYNVGDLLLRTYVDIIYRLCNDWREYRGDGLDPNKMDAHFEFMQK